MTNEKATIRCEAIFSDDKEYIRKGRIVKRGIGLKTCLQKMLKKAEKI